MDSSSIENCEESVKTMSRWKDFGLARALLSMLSVVLVMGDLERGMSLGAEVTWKETHSEVGWLSRFEELPWCVVVAIDWKVAGSGRAREVMLQRPSHCFLNPSTQVLLSNTHPFPQFPSNVLLSEKLIAKRTREAGNGYSSPLFG